MKKQQNFRFVIAATLLLAFSSVAFSQQHRNAAPDSFKSGEELVYVGEFSRTLLRNIDVADFRFSAVRSKPKTPALGNGHADLLKLIGDVTSKGFFTKLFNLRFRQHVESVLEPSSFTLQTTTRIDEQGKRTRKSESIYDKAKGEVRWTEVDPNNPSATPRTASTQYSGQVHDVLSAIYFLRTQPLTPGKTFDLTISDSGRIYRVPVRVVERKRMKTVLGRVNTIRVDPQLFGQKGMIARRGELQIWMTDDSRRIPVKAKVKTEYGTFDITLKKVIQNPSREYLTAR